MEAWIVDCHSHLVPSGDDGARTVEDGIRLLRNAARHGTKIVYATPHIHTGWDSYPLTAERRRIYEQSFPVACELAAGFGLELRHGFELFPGALPSGADLREYALGESGFLLVEFPGSWCAGIVDEPCRLVFDQAVAVEEAGLVPVLAHPERCAEIIAQPSRLERFRERGWFACLNSSSLTAGSYPRQATACAWQLLDAGAVDLVASDAHGDHRPPMLDWAYELVAGRYGEEYARPLFDGSALQAGGIAVAA